MRQLEEEGELGRRRGGGGSSSNNMRYEGARARQRKEEGKEGEEGGRGGREGMAGSPTPSSTTFRPTAGRAGAAGHLPLCSPLPPPLPLLNGGGAGGKKIGYSPFGGAIRDGWVRV